LFVHLKSGLQFERSICQRPGAAKNIEEKRFDQVIGMMGQENAIRFKFLSRLRKKTVAS